MIIFRIFNSLPVSRMFRVYPVRPRLDFNENKAGRICGQRFPDFMVTIREGKSL